MYSCWFIDLDQGCQTSACRPNPVYCLFLYSLWANGFTFLNGWTKSKEDYFMMWKLYEIKILMSINKVILEHSHIICLYFVSGCFCITPAEMRRCSRDGMIHQAYSIYCLALYRWSVQTPGLDMYSLSSPFFHLLNTKTFQKKDYMSKRSTKMSKSRDHRCVIYYIHSKHMQKSGCLLDERAVYWMLLGNQGA